jgi:hypothetical protein
MLPHHPEWRALQEQDWAAQLSQERSAAALDTAQRAARRKSGASSSDGDGSSCNCTCT